METTGPFSFEIDTEIILACFRSNDDMGIVLRVHMEVERSMIRELERRFPNYGALKFQFFDQHLKALKAFGKFTPLSDAITQINVTRNKFAHVRNIRKTDLTQSDLNNLYHHTAAAFTSVPDLKKIDVKIDEEGLHESLIDLTPARQFAIIGAMIVGAIETMRQRQSAKQVEILVKWSGEIEKILDAYKKQEPTIHGSKS
ncbi:MAG: hypothetical protein JKY32_02325 [Rhizobiales bacterium]|nr:hypothetical protein [Hyphomicrobiales bacterium]